MQTKQQIIIFLSEFDHQVGQIEKIYKYLKGRLEAIEREVVSMEIVESIGYWLHNLYCAYEDLFKIVSSFWENNLTNTPQYHMDLLKRMIVDIREIRPALLQNDSYAYLNELRGFRHVFRHAYSYGLDDERVKLLLRKTIQQKYTILRDIRKFKSKIEKLLEL